MKLTMLRLFAFAAMLIAGAHSKPQNWDWTSGSYYGASPDYRWGGNDVSSYSNSMPSYSTGQWSQYQPGEDWNTQQAPTYQDPWFSQPPQQPVIMPQTVVQPAPQPAIMPQNGPQPSLLPNSWIPQSEPEPEIISDTNPPADDMWCKQVGQQCGIQATNPPQEYGECCSGLECHHEVRGGIGICKSKGPICRSVNETCGFQSTSPSRYHGFCCEGFVCTYFNAGGAGKCETVPEGESIIDSSASSKSTCDNDDLVLDLNLDQLKMMVSVTTRLLVEFYKPGCAACENFSSEYKQAAKDSKDAYSGIIFARVNIENCIANLKEELSIETFPRILYWSNGLPGTQNAYPGNPQRYYKEFGLTAERLENWLQDRTNYATQQNSTYHLPCGSNSLNGQNDSFFEQFQCNNGKCISASKVCDGESNSSEEQCDDDSDEKFCDST